VGFDNGTEAEFHVFQKEDSSADKLYDTLKTSVNSDKIEYEWEFQYKDDENDPAAGKQTLDKYSLPQFYFIADVQGVRARSGMLPVSDELNIVLKDENGNPIPNEEYVVYLSNGEIRKGKLDKNGEAIEKNIPIKKCRVEFPNMAGAKKLPQ
ncbi:MAG: hypothetical protein NTV06_07290, partial [candidate division Zixibacteria bacterium]|nr:hypothetical protein [candidate division Zixibacteria bacterium]